MRFEIDHILICTDLSGPEAEQLCEFGLFEGSSNKHPGQGTSNRRFFFHNVMLELLWVHSRAEAQSERTQRMGLWERWQGRQQGACPFGIALRPTEALLATDDIQFPFEGWVYQPLYLPAEMSIFVANNSLQAAEPLFFAAPFFKKITELDQSEPINHPLGFNEITAVTVASPSLGTASASLTALKKVDGLRFVEGPEHHLTLSVDGEKSGRSKNFSPALPLTIKW